MKSTCYLIPILLLSLTLRAVHLDTVPAWYWDEGYHLNLGENIVEGRILVYGLRISLLPHPPSYHLIAGLISKTVHNPLICLRIISVLLSVPTVCLIYLIGSELYDSRLGLTASLVYALFPSAIYWNRILHPNNLLLPLSLLGVFLLLRYTKTKRPSGLAYAIGASLIAFITEYTQAAVMASTVILLKIFDSGRTALKAALIFLLALTLYLTVTFACTQDIFVQEFTSQFKRYNVAYMVLIPAAGLAAYTLLHNKINTSPLENLFYNKPGHHIILFYLLSSTLVLINPMSDYQFLSGLDIMLLIGTLGLFHLPRTDGSRKLLALTIPLYALLAVTRRTDHALMPLHPYISLAAASFINQAYLTLRDTPILSSRRELAALLAAVIIPMLLFNDAQTFISSGSLNPEDLKSDKLLADYLNARTRETDVIAAPSQITPILPGRTTTLVEAAAYDGRMLLFLSHHEKIPAGGFLYNVSIRNVRYAVMPEMTPSWMLDQGFGPVIDAIRQWNSTRAGGYIVYANPAKV